MRKNFMLSLAAMAALPMAGLANTAWQVSPVTDWTLEAGTELKASTPEKIFGLGAGISQKVTLPKGRYTLKATTVTNAELRIWVGSKFYLPNESFDLDATTEVKLELTASNPSVEFGVTGLHFELAFDFAAVATNVASKHSAAHALLKTNDENADSWTKKLWEDDAAIEAAIAKIQNVGSVSEEGKAAFEVYMDQELYNYGNAKTPSKIEKTITALENAAKIINYITGNATLSEDGWIATLNATLDGCGDYAKGVYADAVATKIEELEGKLAEWEDDYKAGKAPVYQGDGTAADTSVYKQYNTKLTNLNQSISAYNTVKLAFDAAETKYQRYMVEFDKIVRPATQHAKADYSTLQEKAKEELTKAYNPLALKMQSFPETADAEFNGKAAGFNTAISDASAAVDAVRVLYYAKSTSTDPTPYFITMKSLFNVTDGDVPTDPTKKLGFEKRVDALKQKNDAFHDAFGKNMTIVDSQSGDEVEFSNVVNTIYADIQDIRQKFFDAMSGIEENGGLVVENYTTDRNAVWTTIKAWEDAFTAAGTCVADLADLKAAVKDAQDALTAANTAVAAMTAEGYTASEAGAIVVEGYKASDYWYDSANKEDENDAVTTIKETINGYENAVNALTSSNVTAYKTSNLADIEAIVTTIDTYKSNAQATYDAYKSAKTFLTAWGAEYDRVRAFVTNTAVTVTVGGSPSTYGAELNACLSSMKTVKDALATAMGKTVPSVHHTAMTGISIPTGDPSIKAFTKTQYDIHKEAYEFPHAIADANDRAAEVQSYAAEVKSLLDDASSTYGASGAAATYGNRYTTEILGADGIADEKTVNGLTAYFMAVPGVNQSTGAYEYTALTSTNTWDDIYNFIKTLDAAFTKFANVKQSLSELDTRAAQIAQDVQDNLDAYNEYVLYYNGGTHPVTGETITSYSDQADAISAQKASGNPDTGIAAECQAIKDLAVAYKNALDAAKAAETVKANATGENGFDAQKAAIEKRLEQFGTTVTASNDNWKAYKTLYYNSTSLFKKNLITPGGAAGNIANKAYLSINTIDNPGHNHYAGVAQQLSEDIAALEADIQTYYAKVECKTKYDEVAARINKLVEDVNACLANCKINDDNYALLGEQYTTVCNVYNTVKNFIDANDKSSKKDEWLGKVNAEKTNIETNKGKVEDAFGEGKLATDYNTYKDNYSTYEKNINDIKGKWLGDEDGYYAKVMADNSKMHTDFLDAYKAANERYEEVTESLNKFLDLSIDKTIVATALEELYAVKAALDVTKTEEGEKYYENLVANNAITPEKIQNGIYPEVFTGDYLTAAEQALTDIKAEYKNATDQLNEAADAEFRPYVTAAETAITYAYNEIAAAGYYGWIYNGDVMYNHMFKDIKASLATEKALLDDPELALKYTDHIETVKALYMDTETGKSELYQVKENVAQYAYNNWSADWAQYNTQMQNWAQDEVYGKYADGTFDGTNYKADFDAAYQTFENEVNTLVKGAESLYEVSGAIRNLLLNNFYADSVDPSDTGIAYNIYKAFQTLIQNHDASEADYNKFFTDATINATARIEAVRQNIATAEDYAKKFAVSTSIDAAKTALDYFDVTLPTIRENDGVHLQDLTDKLTAAEDAAKDLCVEMNKEEKTFIAAQIERLKGDVINAKVEDVDAYNAKITQYLADLAALNMNEVDGTTQKGLLDLQDAVADDRAELTGFDAQAVKDKLTAELEQNTTVYNEATAGYATLFPFQQTALGPVNVTTDELAGKVESNFENNTLIFNAEKLEVDIQKETSALEVYNLRVQAAKEVKATHEAAVERLEGELDNIDAQYSALNEKLMGYSEEVQELFLGFAPYYEANKASETERLAAVPANGDELLDGDSALKFNNTNSGSAVPPVTRAAATVTPPLQTLPSFVTTFEEYFAYVDKFCSNKEVIVRMDKFYTEVFSTVDFNVEGGYIYDMATLTAEQSDIDVAYDALDTYRIGAYYRGIVSADIDGKAYTKFNDAGIEVPDPQDVDFVTECAAMFDKITELADRVEQLKSDIAVNTFFMGDIDHDKVVDVNDFATLKLHLLGEYELDAVMKTAADVNGDGKVNIGDLTRLVAMILDPNVTPAAPVRVAMPYATSNDALSVVVEGEGVHQRIGIMLDAQQLYAGCQMDILLPEGVTLVGESLGEMAAALSLSSNDLENGCHRIILSSIEGNAMTTGNGAMIWLDVDVDHNYSGEGIALSNVLFANAAGRTFELSVANNETTGLSNVSMTQEVKEKIYNVGGILMDSLKRGVNIIRGNDGTSKKVLK